MKILDEITLWMPFLIVGILSAIFLFGDVNDLRFIRLCGVLSVTYSTFTWVEIQQIKRRST